MFTIKLQSFLLIVIISFLLLKQEAVSQKNNPLAKLKAQHDVTKVTLDTNGVPKWLEGKLTPKGLKGKPEELTFQFFEENKDLYKMQNPANELKIARVTKGATNKTHIRLKQFYNGIEVYGSELITHFTETNELESVNGEFLAGITVSTTPTVTPEVAEMIMLDNLQTMFELVKPEVRKKQLLIYPFENKIYLTWNFVATFDTPQVGDWEYYIDAHTGNIIYTVSRLIH